MNLPSIHRSDSGLSAGLWSALLGSILVAGCLIIPVDYPAANSRHNLKAESTNALNVRVTTREDVLLALGEPDFVSEDGQRFGYMWTKVKAIWVVAGSSGGTGGEITRSYLVEVTFDPSNLVSDVRLQKEWGDAVTGTPEDESPR